MKNTVAELLDSFEHLSDEAKRQVALEIMKRSTQLELPPLDDDSLVKAADEVFLAFDENESKRG